MRQPKFPPIQNHSERWKCNRSRSFIEWRKSLSQSKDKCQRSTKHGNSRKFTDGNVDVPVQLKSLSERRPNDRRQGCKGVENSAGSLIESLTSCCAGETDSVQTPCKDAERSERHSTSKSDATCKDKIHEKES